MRHHLAAVILALGLCSAPVMARTDAWRQMALEDLRAAKLHIEENHPAAVPQLEDRGFQSRLADFSRFEQMASQVATMGGYVALLDRFAASFGDRHISRYPIVEPPTYWPGFVVGRSGDSWVVKRGTAELPEDSNLTACDGRTPEAMAETNLAPYTPDWSLRAQRYRAATRLFVNRGDPFIELPRSCIFRLPSGQLRTIAISWQRITPEDLARALAAAGQEVAITNGLADFGNGRWLRLGTFQDEVRPTVEQFVAQRDRLTGASFVIVDVRGNGGGSAAYGSMVAAALYGSRAVGEAETRIALGGDEVPVWRASPGNLSLIEEMVTRFSEQLGAGHSTTRYFIRSAEAMRVALASGQDFSQAASDPTAQTPEAQSEMVDPLRSTPRVFILTDFACFSACLETVQLFRELGAVQIGEDTDGGLNYFEVRAVPLPSGLAYFSTMQAYSRSRPLRLGPFQPSHRYEGDPADEPRVQAWVASLVGADDTVDVQH